MLPVLEAILEAWLKALKQLKPVGSFVLYAAMLIAILALWNNDAPQFIYVSF